MRIDLLKEIKDVNLPSFRFLPEFIKVMGRDETYIMPQ